jgi:chromosome segregation ATPase
VTQFDESYNDSRAVLDAALKRLKEIESELAKIEDDLRGFDDSEPRLDAQIDQALKPVHDLENEIGAIKYAQAEPAMTGRALAELRASYREEVERFEQRFKNSAAEGKLEVLQSTITQIEEKLRVQFEKVDSAEAERFRIAGDLAGQASGADEAVAQAQAEWGAAGNFLNMAVAHVLSPALDGQAYPVHGLN